VAEEEMVEASLDAEENVDPLGFGEIRPWPEAQNRYLALLRSFLPDLRLSGLRIVVDCAHGATAAVAPAVFGELGASVRFLGAEPEGSRINSTGAAATSLLQKTVRAEAFDLGIGFDGDGDRAVFVDETGTIVEGDQLLAALAPYLLSWGEIRAPAVVFTVLANMGTEIFLRKRGFEVVRVPVGDRNVAWAMREKGVDLGGEPSGHLIFRRYTVTGDGILTSLLVLSYLQRLGVSLRTLVGKVPLFPQVREDVPVGDKDRVVANPAVQKAIASAEKKLAGKGRIVVRPSGTQPLVRIMAEGPEEAELKRIVAEVAEAVRAADLSRSSASA
jgi:phosphoglucosamine mutase